MILIFLTFFTDLYLYNILTTQYLLFVQYNDLYRIE